MSSPPSKRNGIGVTAYVTVYDPVTKAVVHETCKENDMAVDNFMKFMQALFSPNGGTNVTTATIPGQTAMDQMDATGTDRTIVYWTNGGGGSLFLNNQASPSCRVKVHAGDSNTAVVRSNFKLNNLIASIEANTPATRSGGTLTLTGAILNGASGVTVREVGLSIALLDGTTLRDFLMFHDVVADTAISANQPYSVTYVFTFP